MKYILYAHINKINKKRQIGITSRNPEIRWGRNGIHYKDSPKFWKAIEKYGWDNFEHVILLEDLTQEDARKMEIEYIEKYNSIENGYNISPGGDVPPILRGKEHPNYGKGFSQETLRKMKENHADFKRGKHPRARKVVCIETNVVYDTITDAAEAVGISRKCVNDTCLGRQKSAAGYHWKYIDVIS